MRNGCLRFYGLLDGRALQRSTVESSGWWMVRGAFQVSGSLDVSEMGQGACQLDGGSRVWRWGIV